MLQNEFGEEGSGYMSEIRGDQLWDAWTDTTHISDTEAQKNADECATGSDPTGTKRPTLPKHLEILTHEQRL